jgi:GR25 family glycosyltransferase involved in LPS biosynthesis
MIFNSIFDNIYVLNLKESIDRKIHIENEFKRVGIEKYEFFEATSYDSEETKKLTNTNFVKKFPNCFRCNLKRCDCKNNFLTKFQIANWISFINIFKDIIKNNYKFVLICEDDIVFTFQYKRIINKLLSKETFRYYKINMNKPLLIRLGTAFNDQNHNSNSEPYFIKNYALCNPCFAINSQMALVYLQNLKIIDYHSDIYFHKKIPMNVKVQYFTMYPYPIYELSFVKSKQKFKSLIRPNNELRRLEYKEFLFLSSNILLTMLIQNCINTTKLDIKLDKIGYHGTNNYFLLLPDSEKIKYYFEYKILLIDNYYDDIKIIYNNLFINKHKLLLNKVNDDFNLELNNVDNNIKSSILFYEYYLKLINKVSNLIIIDINKNYNLLNKFFNEKFINDEIIKYQKCKEFLLKDNKLTNNEIDNEKNKLINE